MSGYTGYSNFIHLKPSLALAPATGMKLVAAIGMLWRQTTQDAVYVQPDIPIPGTAGRPGRRTGSYAQLQFNWIAARNLTFGLEADRYFIAQAVRRAGGHDSSYVGADVRWGW